MSDIPSNNDSSTEERVLRMVKKVLTDVAKDTNTSPGMKHPLSDDTIAGIRDCLALISSREQELQQHRGISSQFKPRFADEPQSSVVVSINTNKTSDKERDRD